LKVQIPYRRAGGPPNLLVDIEPWERNRPERPWQGGSGSLATASGRPAGMGRSADANGASSLWPWTASPRKSAPVGSTSSREGGSPVLPDLLGQIPEVEGIGTATVDGAQDTRRCHCAIIARSAAAFGHPLEPIAGMLLLPISRNGRS
jgi:hypothetical protein